MDVVVRTNGWIKLVCGFEDFMALKPEQYVYTHAQIYIYVGNPFRNKVNSFKSG